MLLLLSAFFFMVSCGDDDEDMVDPCDSFTATYNGDVKAIIDGSCAYSGCHSGGTDANAGIPTGSNDFTTFAALFVLLLFIVQN